jgi:predicted outer membrane lipoprotein
MMLAGVAAAVIVRILPSTRFANFRTPVGLALALAFGIPSLFAVWREFMSKEEVTPAASLSRQSRQQWQHGAQRASTCQSVSPVREIEVMLRGLDEK